MSVRMMVSTPNQEIFDSYYYGYGNVLSQELRNGYLVTLVDYGKDMYRAEYQAGRFASGLYRAEVFEVEA